MRDDEFQLNYHDAYATVSTIRRAVDEIDRRKRRTSDEVDRINYHWRAEGANYFVDDWEEIEQRVRRVIRQLEDVAREIDRLADAARRADRD